jgi:hypothetical protein
LVSTGFEIEAEIAVKVAQKGYPFTEYPITYKPKKSGRREENQLERRCPRNQSGTPVFR